MPRQSNRYPTMRSHRLGIALRRLRREAGFTGDEVVEKLRPLGRWSPTKLSRIEAGLVEARHGDISDLLDLYGLDGEDNPIRTELISLARDSAKRGRWFEEYGGILKAPFHIYLDFEEVASDLCKVGSIVPGLLQTREYARALIASSIEEPTPEEVELMTDLRMSRQKIFERNHPPNFTSLLDESVLRRTVGGPNVLRAQLEHLLEMTERSNVSVNVIPYTAGEYPAIDAPFSIIGFSDPLFSDVVYMEHMIRATYLDDPGEVEIYKRRFKLMQSASLNKRESRKTIAKFL